MNQKIRLGDKVRDLITGYEGIVVAKIEYPNGCIQFGVKARVKEAAIKEAEYIDEDQLKRIGDGINLPAIKPVTEKRRGPGGLMLDRPQSKTGRRRYE